MKNLKRIALLGLIAALTALALRPEVDRVSAGQPDLRDKLQWGVLLQTERPFYAGGEMMRATIGAFNFSNDDAFGWQSGCISTMTIENDQGQIVWEPWERICGGILSFPSLLSNGGRMTRTIQVPLVYYNNQGVGTQGNPLPAGFYKVNFSLQLHGPNRIQGDTPLGLDYSASVPIRIE